jgi:hypothetical protein
VVTILVVAAALVVGVVVLRVPQSTKSGTPPITPPLSSVFGIESGSVDAVGHDSGYPDCVSTNCSFYNFTLVQTGRSLLIGVLTFAVFTPTGSEISIGGVGVENDTSGQSLGYFDHLHGTWYPSTISSNPLRSDFSLSLFVAGISNLQNDELSARATLGYTGTVSALIT